MEQCKELLDKHWTNPQDDPLLMDKPAEKDIDTIPYASFVSSVFVRSAIVKGS